MSADDKSTAAAGAPAEMAQAMAQMHLAALAPLGAVGPAWMEAMQNSAKEMSEFVVRRLEKDMHTQKALLECRNVADMQQIQSQAIREAIDDYRDEADRLAAIARDFLAATTAMPPQVAKG